MMPSPSHVRHLHPFLYSHYFAAGPSIQTKTTSPDWILRPTWRRGPGPWKPHRACQLLTDLRREFSAEAQARSQPSPGPQAPDTLLLLALTPFTCSSLPACTRPCQCPNSSPTHRANPGRASVCPGGRYTKEYSVSPKQKRTSSGTAPLPLRDLRQPLSHLSLPQQICSQRLHNPPSGGLEMASRAHRNPHRLSSSKAIRLYSGLLPGKGVPIHLPKQYKACSLETMPRGAMGVIGGPPALKGLNSGHHPYLSRATHPPRGREWGLTAKGRDL